jgi:NAD(P)H-quinone oxidoreductase subunit 5
MEEVMTYPVALFPLIAPLGLVSVAAVGRREPGPNPHRVLAAARAASVLSLVVAAAAAGVAGIRGPLESPVLGLGGLGPSIRLDGVSTAMLCLVAFLGAVVLEYSRGYLDGDAGHGRFVGRLALTVAAVMLLVLSGNLLQLSIMWLLTSLALHRLLLFYPGRPGAVLAARKKFIVARLGDVALAVAAVLLMTAFGTADLGLLLARASAAAEAGAVPPGVHVAAALVVATAALKSAQFPTHGWLAEVMETPTPVSALLHAGILNGGPFIVVRLASIVLLSPGSLYALVLIGGCTALFASVVMITQSTVKGSLAYSSAAHMGFMLLLCGLGAYGVAMAHLIAHSCYKAHAFLSSGSAIEASRASKVPGGKAAPRTLAWLAALGAAFATVAGVGALAGVSIFHGTVMFGIGVILAIGLAQLLVQAVGGGPGGSVVGRIAVAAAATALAFFALEIAAGHVLRGVVPVVALENRATLALMALVVAIFGLTGLLQVLLPVYGRSPYWAAAWVHVRNGFYANAVFDRFVGALRPIALASTAPVSIEKEIL